MTQMSKNIDTVITIAGLNVTGLAISLADIESLLRIASILISIALSIAVFTIRRNKSKVDPKNED